MSPIFPLLAIVIVPTLEEVLFRSWLGINWGVMLIMPLLLWGAAAVTYMQDKSIPESVDFMIIVGLSTLIFVYIIQYCRAALHEARTDKALHSVFPMVFWATAILFGTIHITNFEGSSLGLYALIVTLPQVFIGAGLGFLRMRFGLLTAIGFHGAYNGTLLFISFLALQTMKGHEGLLIESLKLLM